MDELGLDVSKVLRQLSSATPGYVKLSLKLKSFPSYRNCVRIRAPHIVR